MKTKNITTALLAFITACCAPASAQDAEKKVAVTELKDGDSIHTIYGSYAEMRADSKISEDNKAAQQIRILVIAVNYLNTHKRPEGKVQWNIQPPDGGLAGAAPESVKDPNLRAQYVKKIEENNAKAEAQNSYDSFVALQNQILTACVTYSNAKEDNANVISDAIEKSSKDNNQAATLKRLIEEKAVELKKQPPKWSKKEK